MMSLGLFLDVDRTLTVDLIQRQYANCLGVGSRYEEIESLFRDEKINSAEFGRRLIAIFGGAGFSRQKSKDFFDRVELQEWTEDLLRLHDGNQISVYLVSAGPDYYVQSLAAKFGIPIDNVYCSHYDFSQDGRIDRCRSVDKQSKARFVEERAKTHRCAVGVGDDSRHDGPFLQMCDIQILTQRDDGTLHTPTLQVVHNLAIRLASRFGVSRELGAYPRVFIGCSREQLGHAELFQRQIEGFCDAQLWCDGVFQGSDTNLESLERAVRRFDFGVFMMVGEDEVVSRDNVTKKVRDNVVFEFGLFVGGLGRPRCLLLVPKRRPPVLPSDVSGIVVLAYDDDRIPGNSPAAFRSAAVEVEARVKELGRRRMI
jgi:predicted nucleotide-binding protein